MTTPRNRVSAAQRSKVMTLALSRLTDALAHAAFADAVRELTAALYAAGRAELRQRLIEVARTDPSVAREVSHVDELLRAGLMDELPAEWCRRLKLPIGAANKLKVIVVREHITGPRGEPLAELDRVVFDYELREGAPRGEVWLDVALVHTADLPSDYRCCISTRFTLADKRVRSTIVNVQRRWSGQFGAHFFEQGEVKPYVYSLRSGKLARAYGKGSRYNMARDVGRIYQYLDVIAHAWDWYASDPQATSRTVQRSVRDNAPPLALALFAAPSHDARKAVQKRPKLTVALVERVGQALGYVTASGMRRTKGKARPRQGSPVPAPRGSAVNGAAVVGITLDALAARLDEIDLRLLPLVAKILAQKYRKPFATLLRTVVRPALLGHAFTGFRIDSAERILRPSQSTDRRAKRSRTPALRRPKEPRREKG